MARHPYQNIARDVAGNVLSDANVTIYEYGTTNPATVYASELSSTPLSSGPQIQSNSLGVYTFWLDDSEYGVISRFTIVCEVGSKSSTIPCVRVIVPWTTGTVAPAIVESTSLMIGSGESAPTEAGIHVDGASPIPPKWVFKNSKWMGYDHSGEGILGVPTRQITPMTASGEVAIYPQNIGGSVGLYMRKPNNGEIVQLDSPTKIIPFSLMGELSTSPNTLALCPGIDGDVVKFGASYRTGDATTVTVELKHSNGDNIATVNAGSDEETASIQNEAVSALSCLIVEIDAVSGGTAEDLIGYIWVTPT